MKGILASLLVKLGLDSKEFEKGVNDAKQKTNAFADGIKRIGGIIAGAFAVERIIAFGRELLNLSGQIEGVRSAFMRMADPATLNELKDATKGTVSELDLMKRAVQAQNLGLPIKNLASLFEFATKRAQDTGQSVDYLVDSIVLGIGRKSPLILDNLGISAIALKEKLKGVGMETASVADIAKAVGEIAAESMRESGSIIETNAIKIQQLTSSWDDFKASLAESTVINKVGSGILEFGKNTVKSLDIIFSQPKAFLSGGFAKATAAYAASMFQASEKSKELNTEQTNQLKTEEQLAEERKKAIEQIDKQNEAYNKQIELLQTIEDTKRKAISSIGAKAVNPEDLKPATDANVQGEFGDIFSRFPLSAEKEEDLNFDTEAFQKKSKQFNQFKEDMASAVADFGVNVVEEFGQSLGEMIASGNFDFSDFGKNILAGIGGFISQLGKMLIGLGIASEAFQSLLKSAFTNPVSAGLAIAAGAALVLLGGAIQGFAKAGPTGSGASSSVSTPSYSRAGSPSQGYRAEDNKVVFEIKGDKLVGVLNNVQRKNLNMA